MVNPVVSSPVQAKSLSGDSGWFNRSSIVISLVGFLSLSDSFSLPLSGSPLSGVESLAGGEVFSFPPVSLLQATQPNTIVSTRRVIIIFFMFMSSFIFNSHESWKYCMYTSLSWFLNRCHIRQSKAGLSLGALLGAVLLA